MQKFFSSESDFISAICAKHNIAKDEVKVVNGDENEQGYKIHFKQMLANGKLAEGQLEEAFCTWAEHPGRSNGYMFQFGKFKGYMQM